VSAVDWPETHARLEKLRLALQQTLSPGPAEQLKVLRSRARALARQSIDPRVGEDALELVTVVVAGEVYGVEASYVREVYPLKALAPLPGTPSFVRGIVHLRGRIVPVIDIRKFFNLPDKGLSDLNKLVVVGSEAILFAILADVILGIRRLPLSELQPSLPAVSGVRSEYLRGMSGDRLVVLAIERIIADPKLMVEQKIEI
jgi:purine-binding chemotaxis protein CheW